MAEQGRIVPLDASGRELTKGEPDPKGWDVIAADGERIGEVDQLLVDTSASKVRYLDVELDRGALPMGVDAEEARDWHVLIPIGYARLVQDEKKVVVEGLRADDISNLPPLEHQQVSREYEVELRRHLDERFQTQSVTMEGFYQHEMYNDDSLRKKGK